MWLFQFHTSSTCLHWLNSALCSEPDAPLAFTLITDSFIGKYLWILFSDMITQTHQCICPGIMEKLSLFCLMAYATVKKCKGKLYLSSDSCLWKDCSALPMASAQASYWVGLTAVYPKFICSPSAHSLWRTQTQPNETSHPFLHQHHHLGLWHQDQSLWIFRATGKQGKKHIWFCETVPCTQK